MSAAAHKKEAGRWEDSAACFE